MREDSPRFCSHPVRQAVDSSIRTAQRTRRKQQDEMVDLDDRLDSFFDPAKMSRRPGESVKDFIDRFELTYSKVTAIGESLSVKS